jgi:tetratricopeptide (TPR) repeat protein
LQKSIKLVYLPFFSLSSVIEFTAPSPTFFIADNPKCDEAYFLLGNAYCKKNDWREALNAYCQAIDLNPNGPARMAYEHIIEILDFFHHDLYNP